jgi:hypothetical protein
LAPDGNAPIFEAMKVLALASFTLMLAATPALAQVTPWSPYGGAGTAGADLQRYRIEQQRQQAEASEALARQQALQTRLTLMELQARRMPAPTADNPTPAVRSPEQERAAREAATARRQTTTQGVGQIDRWLDRRPHQGVR